MKIYRSLYILFTFLAATIGFSACNETDSSEDVLDTSSLYAVMVKSFNLSADDSILANLDSVYFSIDLNNARIFNADSLPLGTRVDSLHISLTHSAAAVAEITMPSRFTGNDTVVNYLENSTEAINFNNGYVTLHLESSNKEVKRDYRIYVNVHKMKPDSLAWGDAAWAAFPTSLSRPTALRAVEFKGKAYCFASDGSSLTRAVAANPADNNWTKSTLTLPAGLDVNSITAGSDALFAIGSSSKLLTSTDEGASWTETSSAMTHIFGSFGSRILGVNRKADGSYVYVTYPATVESSVPASAPVAQTSQCVTFVTEWATEPMLMTMGGVTASGAPTGHVWAYDGQEWADITMSAIPDIADLTLVPYFSVKVGSNWVARTETALIAFGGHDASGAVNRKLYISTDRGINWSLAGQLMQLPEDFPSLSGAEALVFEKTLTSRAAASAWHSLELPVMPAWLSLADSSTGIAPITSWDCPYIYVFGGTDASGALNTAVWRGVINRLSFKPLQ